MKASIDHPVYETDYARDILAGLQRKHVYQSTVAPDVIADRRARNRTARRSRRINRKARAR